MINSIPTSSEIVSPERLLSCAIRVPGLTAGAFLAQARGSERFLWQTADRTFAGTGTAAELSAWGGDRFQKIETQTRLLFRDWIGEIENRIAAPRLFGGFSFQSDFTPDNTWSIYAPALFILPHYQFAQTGSDAPWLILNVTLTPEDDPVTTLAGMREALEQRAQLLLQAPDFVIDRSLTVVDRQTPMLYPAWESAIENARAQIRAGDLKKVVLARAFELRFAERLNVENALNVLSARYRDCYRFLFEPRAYHAFYGATPELLARLEGNQLTTMALAGSVRRGKTPEEDETLAAQLMHDPKERLEHELVVAALRDRLRPQSTSLEVPAQPQVLRLSNIQHLYTPVQAVLRESIGVFSCVEQLHPTPALGGAPRDAAMQFIRDAEPVPRGWYAAPIGWVAPTLDGEFGVGIRSAVSEDRRVWLYAGAGIVEQSQAQKEWDETGLKFRPMLEALGVQD